MKKKYPILNFNYYLHISADECILYNKVKNIENDTLKISKQWKINPLMARYILLCDGNTTHEQISDELNVPYSILVDKGAEFLQLETNVIYFNDYKDECKDRLIVTGTFDSYMPLHVSLEITDYCNFRCKHCYVSSSPEKLTKRSYKDTIRLIDELYENGVQIIELTGGECTTHPKFKEILEYASQRFELVAVISNGYLIGEDEELAKFIGSLDNVVIQISLDGMKEFHDNFRSKEGAFENAVKAIKYLKKYNVLLRVGSSITYDNVDQIEDLFKLCKELDVDAFGVSPVSNLGRAKCSGCSNGSNELEGKISSYLEKYRDDKLLRCNKLAIERAIKSKEINCGAGWRGVAINGASGIVRTCLLLEQMGILGNVDTDNYKDIFSREKIDALKFAPAPSPYLETCKECMYKEECKGCMAKALDVYKNYNPDCEWIKKYKIKP